MSLFSRAKSVVGTIWKTCSKLILISQLKFARILYRGVAEILLIDSETGGALP